MRETPSQTAGPYLHIGMMDEFGAGLIGPDMRRAGASGKAIALVGAVLDGAGAPVADAVVELWQPDAEGRFPPGADAGLSHLGRSACDADGTYRFETVRPGVVPGLEADLLPFPGHVLLGVGGNDPGRVILDPFQGGALVSHETCLARLAAMGAPPSPDWLRPADDRAMLVRQTRNLSAAMLRHGRERDAQMFARLSTEFG